MNTNIVSTNVIAGLSNSDLPVRINGKVQQSKAINCELCEWPGLVDRFDQTKTPANDTPLLPKVRWGLIGDASVSDGRAWKLSDLAQKYQSNQLKSLQESILSSQKKIELINKRQMERLKEFHDRMAQAAKSSKLAKIFGHIAKALGIAVGIFMVATATMASGGAATPALVMASLALIGSIITVAGDAAAKNGERPFSIATVLEDLGEKMGHKSLGTGLGLVCTAGLIAIADSNVLNSCVIELTKTLGGSEQDSIIAGTVITVLGGLLIARKAGGLFSRDGAADPKALENAAKLITKEKAQIVTQISQVFSSVNGLPKAGFEIEAAKARLKADYAETRHREGEADGMKVRDEWQSDEESFASILEAGKNQSVMLFDMMRRGIEAQVAILDSLPGTRA